MYKLPVITFRTTELKLFKLKYQKWLGDGSLKIGNFWTCLTTWKKADN